MSLADLQLSEWAAFSDADARAYCEALAVALPLPVAFTGLADHGFAGRQFRLACFEYDGAAFSLLPGGDVRLGFDPDRFRPTAEQEASYADTEAEYGIGMDLRRYLRSVTTNPRSVTLEAFLLERKPREIGLEPLSLDAPEVRQLLQEYKVHSVQSENRDGIIRVVREKRGSVMAWRIVEKNRHCVLSDLETQGCRLLTADEWEYACDAGAETLFRWGNDCPVDRYPTDVAPWEFGRSEAATRRPVDPKWSLHLAPNLFGLEIAQTPYDWEVVAEEGMVRGGDGGCNICGGIGFFMGWLPLASAYWDPHITEMLQEDLSQSYLRRVIPLDL